MDEIQERRVDRRMNVITEVGKERDGWLRFETLELLRWYTPTLLASRVGAFCARDDSLSLAFSRRLLWLNLMFSGLKVLSVLIQESNHYWW
jgi:hypothetical protein